MTSHEIRNPLSAIFQSADSIVSSLSRHVVGCGSDQRRPSGHKRLGTAAPSATSTQIEDNMKDAIDAAQTIILCAQHQKRIVDDVLVLSKADANLLEVSPVSVRLRFLLETSLRMFAAELAANETEMDLCTEESYEQLGIDWVKLDPNRLLQILINLCTNAIKFTTSGTVRRVSVVIGASLERPTGSRYHIRWLSCEKGRITDPTTRPEWGDGEQVYLSFAVQDTGQGINAEEMTLLFQRFQQANPRTHSQYGGSGLGLFISRLLTHLQGGEIGFTSTSGKGSTFAFYVRVRRCSEPPGHDADSTAGSAQTPPGGVISIRNMSGGDKSLPGRMSLNILVVEDNIVNQKVLCRQLQGIGWIVHVADNGQEALDFIKTTRIWRGNEKTGVPLDVILMDIGMGFLARAWVLLTSPLEMPVMNGIAATREIRRLQAETAIVLHIPIVAATANARLEQVAVALESGMVRLSVPVQVIQADVFFIQDDVVSKPFRILELVAKLEGLTRR